MVLVDATAVFNLPSELLWKQRLVLATSALAITVLAVLFVILRVAGESLGGV